MAALNCAGTAPAPRMGALRGLRRTMMGFTINNLRFFLSINSPTGQLADWEIGRLEDWEAGDW